LKKLEGLVIILILSLNFVGNMTTKVYFQWGLTESQLSGSKMIQNQKIKIGLEKNGDKAIVDIHL